VTAIKIIGIGSPMGLDRIGWDAVQGLEQRGLLQRFPDGGIELFNCDRPGSRLVTLLEDTPAAILIDALQGDTTPGEVHRFTPEDLSAYPGALSSHDVGMAQALALGAALGQLPSRLVIYGIEIGAGQWDDEAAMTALTGQAVTQLHPRVCSDIRSWLSTPHVQQNA
jgi:hydrogenase maturation protease